MTNQIIILDDKQAEDIKSDLNISDKEVVTFNYFNGIDTAYKNSSAFLVDINWGFGKPKKGLKIIKEIRETFPHALIIGYSASSAELHKESKDAGADLYYFKSATTWYDDISRIRRIINLCVHPNDNVPLISQKKEDASIVELICRIIEIDRESQIVWFRFWEKDNINFEFDDYIDLDKFIEFEPLAIDQYYYLRKEKETIHRQAVDKVTFKIDLEIKKLEKSPFKEHEISDIEIATIKYDTEEE